MYGENTRKVIIVKGNGKEAQYAQLLFQLIGKLPEFESSQPITEAEYKSSFSTVDNIPKGKVIFFGNGKEAELQGKTINWQYDRFGMKYGWLGNRCVVAADPKAIALKDQNPFAEYYNSRIEEFKQLFELKAITYSQTGTIRDSAREILDMPYDDIDDCIDMEEENVLLKGIKKAGYRAALAPAKGLVRGIAVVGDVLENACAIYERDEIWKRQYEFLVCEFMMNGFPRFMNNIGDKVEKGQAIIVYDVKDSEYAHLLHNLIQQYTGYDVAEFTEKMFIDNAKSLSSRNKIIFLGKTKSAKERWLDNYNYAFNEKGMRYGWFGNHAFVYAKPLKWNERESFINLYKEKGKKYDDEAKAFSSNAADGIGEKIANGLNAYQYFSIVRLYMLPGLMIGEGSYDARKKINKGIGQGIDFVINGFSAIADLSGYQYQLLLREFVFNGFTKFMEEQ